MTATVKGGFFASLKCELPYVVQNKNDKIKNYTKRVINDVTLEIWTDKQNYFPNDIVEVSIECCSMLKEPTDKLIIGVYQNNSAKVIMTENAGDYLISGVNVNSSSNALSKKPSSLKLDDVSTETKKKVVNAVVNGTPEFAKSVIEGIVSKPTIKRFSAKKVIYQVSLDGYSQFYFGKRYLLFSSYF